MAWKKVDKEVLMFGVANGVFDMADCRNRCSEYPYKCWANCKRTPTKIRILEEWEDEYEDEENESLMWRT